MTLVKEADKFFYKADGFDEAVIGIAERCGDLDQVIAYDGGADVCTAIDSLLFIVLTADTHYYTPPINAVVKANAALQFETQNSDLTDGTGSVLQIRCYYEIVTLQT